MLTSHPWALEERAGHSWVSPACSFPAGWKRTASLASLFSHVGSGGCFYFSPSLGLPPDHTLRPSRPTLGPACSRDVPPGTTQGVSIQPSTYLSLGSSARDLWIFPRGQFLRGTALSQQGIRGSPSSAREGRDCTSERPPGSFTRKVDVIMGLGVLVLALS